MPSDATETTQPVLRLDKWLWFARFFKTRTLAAKIVASGVMRVNGDRVVKPSVSIRAGDVLTFPLGDHIRVIEIRATGARRGPAPEAVTLYNDLAPPAPRAPPEPGTGAPAPRDAGAGRPTKRERRETDRLRQPET